MNRYQVTLTGATPLLLHRDNISYSEKIQAWTREPENKAQSVIGDDRSPAWTWIGYVYHDGRNVGIDADNLMTMLREGGTKVLTGKGKETYKKQTQSGLLLDTQQWDLENNGRLIPIKPVQELIGNLAFDKHLDVVEKLGFELLVKRARIGRSKHVRVRPVFRNWTATGTLTVLDEELSGITGDVLKKILAQAGALCGLGDWRPSSPSSGIFGRFTSTVEAIE